MQNRTSKGPLSSETNLETILLPIQGMHCAGCVNRIQSKLSNLNGVISASVNFATESASVSFDNSKISIGDIKESIEILCYNVLLSEEDNVEEIKTTLDVEQYKRLNRDFSIGLILTIPILILNMIFSQSYFFANHLLFVLTTPVLIISGRRFFIGALNMSKQLTADMNTLVAIGTSISFIYSAIATFFPKYFKLVNTNHQPFMIVLR